MTSPNKFRAEPSITGEDLTTQTGTVWSGTELAKEVAVYQYMNIYYMYVCIHTIHIYIYIHTKYWRPAQPKSPSQDEKVEVAIFWNVADIHDPSLTQTPTKPKLMPVCHVAKWHICQKIHDVARFINQPNRALANFNWAKSKNKSLTSGPGAASRAWNWTINSTWQQLIQLGDQLFHS